jgi:hypothetical protein
MAEVIKGVTGSTTIEWGTGDAGGSGKVQSASRRIGGEKVELKDENGETFCVVYFDDKDQCEFTAIVLSGNPPARGDAISIGGVSNCLVDEAELNWQNNNAKMMTVRATKYAGF